MIAWVHGPTPMESAECKGRRHMESLLHLCEVTTQVPVKLLALLGQVWYKHCHKCVKILYDID